MMSDNGKIMMLVLGVAVVAMIAGFSSGPILRYELLSDLYRKESNAWDLLDLTEQLRHQGDFSQALACAQQAADSVGTEHYYYFVGYKLAGSISSSLNDDHMAITMMNKADATYYASSDEGFLLTRGDLLMKAGEYDKAYRDYDAVLRWHPDSPELLSKRAAAWLAMGNDAEALADYTAALENSGDCDNGIKTMLLTNRVALYEKMGEKDKARADFREVMRGLFREDDPQRLQERIRELFVNESSVDTARYDY